MRSLMLTLAALAAGFGLGWYLQDSDQPDRASRVVEQTAPAGISTPRIERPPASEIEPDVGTGRITGRVTDEQGKPVAGVRVIASAQRVYRPRKTRRGTAGPLPVDFERDMGKFIADWKKRQAERRETHSDEDGRYQLTGLTPRPHSLHAYLEGHEVRARSRRGAHRVSPGGTVDFVVATLVRVDVSVTLSNGTMPEAVSLSVERTKSDGMTVETGDAWTPSQQWIDLSPGSYKVSAYLPGDHQSRSNSVSFDVVAGQTAEPVELKIVVRPKLRIRVEPPEGFGGARTRAWIMRITGERVPDAAELHAAGQARYGQMEDEQTWLFANLPEGRYLIGGSLLAAQAVAVTEVVEVNAPLVERTLQLPVPDPRKHYRVRLWAPDDSALRRAQWSNCFRGRTRRSSRGTASQCDEEGVHYIAPESEHAGLSGEHILRVKHEGYGTLEVPVDPKSPTLIDVRYKQPAFALVTVKGHRGTSLEGRLQVGVGGERSREYADLDDAGQARIGPVQPGEFDVRLRRRTGRHGGYELERRRIELRSGDHPIALTVPKLHRLAVRWTGDGRPRMSLRPRRGGQRFDYEIAFSDDGTATFDYLPAGEYRISVQGTSDRQRRTVKVPETTDLSLP